MKVIKASGESENFARKKIYYSIREAGGSKQLAKDAIKEVKKNYRKGITTNEILEIILNFLRREKGVSQRYDLKRAVMLLGPSGFPFEVFFARVLESCGYKTSLDLKLQGKNIIHEVDIVAEKEKKYMVECKYHNEPGIITRIHPALYTYARFLDLEKYNFDFPWLVTNTKCSDDAINYAKGVNLKITSWNYPPFESLLRLIEDKKIYPITILKSLPEKTKLKLYELKIVILSDLIKFGIDLFIKKTGLNRKISEEIFNEIQEIIG